MPPSQPQARVLHLPQGTEQSDADLVLRAKDGDDFGREALFRRHAPRIHGTVVRLLGDRIEAEDVLQDTFVAAFEELPKLREPSAFGGWVLRIAVRKVHRRFRRRNLLRMLGLDGREPDASLEELASNEISPERRAELILVDKRLRGLAPQDRVAWMLRVVEGASLNEVAEACECSLATAKRRIRRAQDEIRVGFAKELVDA